MEVHRPDTKGGLIMTRNRSGRGAVEGSDGYTVPRHLQWILHRKGSMDHLTQSQSDSASDLYEGRGPI